MKKLLTVILLAAAVSACGLLDRQNLGLEKKTPQTVADKKEKLVVPPNYNLRPEEPAARQSGAIKQGL